MALDRSYTFRIYWNIGSWLFKNQFKQKTITHSKILDNFLLENIWPFSFQSGTRPIHVLMSSCVISAWLAWVKTSTLMLSYW